MLNVLSKQKTVASITAGLQKTLTDLESHAKSQEQERKRLEQQMLTAQTEATTAQAIAMNLKQLLGGAK